MTSASIDLFHLNRTNLLVIGSKDKFWTLPGGSILPLALTTTSLEVADNCNAALYEKTLNS